MLPIVAQVSPNDEQKPAVLDRGRDVVVTAGAGTGKTRTLVARYLSLLAEGVPLRSIVAITFTRKAAREMRNRIRAELQTYLASAEMSGDERQAWDELYSQLDAARIGTIHNLCTEMLRAHPAEMGLDPRFEVLDEGQSGIQRQESIDEALAWAADDEQAVRLFSFLGERRLRSVLESLMRQRLETADALGDLPEPLWPHWQAKIVEPIKEFVDGPALTAMFGDLGALKADGTLNRAAAQGDKLAGPLATLLDLWSQLQVARSRQEWAVVVACLRPLRANMKQIGRKDNWSPAEPKVIIKALQTLYDEQMAGFVGKDGINLYLDQQMADLMPALRQLFQLADDVYLRRKTDIGALDFDDLEALALVLLQDHKAARRRWQHEVAAILVDEFQDTNGRQRDLVELISGKKGKLFIVGDAKQSIYRFRGADVTVFRAERDKIAAGGGASYDLSQSYRAHKALVQGGNELLAPILGEAEDLERPWREPFAPLDHHREEAIEGIDSPYIEVQLTVGSKERGALKRAAAALARRLAELVGEKDSAVEYGHVAILCRASTSFAAYEDALDEAGLPYLTVAGRGFYDRPEIRDLLNALKALADPTDDLALVGLLRSPVMGFSDDWLYDLVQQRKQLEQPVSLWRLLRENGSTGAGRVIQLIADLNRRAGRISAASLLKSFLDATDYRAALLLAGHPRAARNVAKLLADTQRSGITSIEQYLEYVADQRAVAVREGEARATAEGAIRLMSIHAAKGLEFPVVVIGDIGYGRPSRLDHLLAPGFGILPRLKDEEGAGSGLFQILRADIDDQEAAESDRLFYVAATRAMDKVILNGCMNLTASGKPSRLGGWLKQVVGLTGLGEQAIDHNEEGDRAIAIDLQLGKTAIGCTVYEPGYQAGIATPRPPAAEAVSETWEPRMVKSLPAGEPRLGDESEQSMQVGTLVHEALAAWRFPGEGFERWVASRARNLGLIDADRIKEVTAIVTELLARFQGHDLFREMDAGGPPRSEVPCDWLDRYRQPRHGKIDALYRKEGAWIVVEYKTDKIEVEDEDELKRLLREKGYFAQLRRYARVVEGQLGQRPLVKLCLLNYQGEVSVHDYLLEGGELSQDFRGSIR